MPARHRALPAARRPVATVVSAALVLSTASAVTYLATTTASSAPSGVPAAAASGSSFTKTGIDQRTGSTATSSTGTHGDARSGDTVKWVLNYRNTTGADATAAITDPITGAQTLVPGSLQTPPGWTGSATGTTVSATGPVRGGTTAAQSIAFSPVTANITTPGGDGYTAEGFGNNVYAVFHHSDDATTVFCATTSNTMCSGWPAFSSFVSPTAGDALGSGSVPALTTPNQNGSFIAGGKLYWPAGSTVLVNGSYPVGIMCLDLTTLKSCGFTQLDTVATAPVGGTLAGIAGDGVRAADGHYYYFDFNGNLLCFNPGSGGCGVTKVTGASKPTALAGAFAEVGTYGRYVFVSYASPNATTNAVTCFDSTSSATCPNFPQTSGSSHNPYASEMLPSVDASGNLLGGCAVFDSVCYDLNGGTIANPWSTTTYGYQVATGFGSGQLIGTRYYTIGAGNFAGCYDFAIPLVGGKVQGCTGFTPPRDDRGYTVRALDNLPGCMVANGDAAQIKLFNAKTGGACATATQSVQLSPAAYYCDGQPGHAISWTSVSLTGLTGAEYAGATVTLFGADGQPLPSWTNVSLPANSASLDISSIPVSGNTSSLTAQVSLAAISDPAKVQASQIKLSWQGDPIQVCYQTVMPDVPCTTSQAVTNTATAITTWGAQTDGPGGNSSGPATFDVVPAPSSCPNLKLTKVVGGRLDPGDQFKVSIRNGAGSLVASATTTGTDPSAATPTTSVVQGATYTLTDAMAAGSTNPLSDYDGTITCTDLTTGAPVVAQGNGPSWQITPTAPHSYACTITNTAVPPTITVVKQVAGRVQPADQFTVGLAGPGGGLGSATTTGALTTASTGALTATSGTTYTVTDAMAAGSPDALSAYVPSIDCRNTTTGDPVTVGGSAPSWTFTPVSPFAYTCTVTNTPAPRSYTVTKTANTSGPVHPGDLVIYTVVVQNTSTVPYTAATPASFTDNLAAVLDDATYEGDATNGATVTGNVLSWSGPLAPQGSAGDSATITYSVRVTSPDTGDSVLRNVVVGGTNCPPGSADAACSTTTKVQSYSIVKSSDATAVTPGEVVHYSITVTNTGAVDYTAGDPASFTDDLTAVLDDASYGNDADHGATYAAPVLSWSGALPVGQSITVHYSVTVDQPDNGDSVLKNVVTTPPDGPCPAGSTNPGCSASVPNKQFSVTKTASQTTADPGDRITFTITVKNTGQVAYTSGDPASFIDDLTGVLDDAIFDGDLDSGANYSTPLVSWSGPLAVGASVTVSYSVTVKSPDTGDKLLRNVVATPTDGSCAVGTTSPGCQVQVPVREYTATKTASVDEAAPGAKVVYTITVTNTGQVAYTAAAPAQITDDLSAVLDDATYGNDAAAAGSGDAPAYQTGVLSWSGALPLGGTVRITYSVTVNDPDQGDHRLTNAVVPAGTGVCAGGTLPPCAPVSVPVRDYTVAKTASAATAAPGTVVTYHVTIENTGQVAFTAADPATFTDDLSDVLDDATYNEDADHGAVYSAPRLTWSGALALGGSLTVTYSVTVDAADLGDHVLRNAVTGGTNCPAGSSAPGCRTSTPVADYTVLKTASATTANPGDTITYTVTVANTGQVAFTAGSPASFVDDLSGVLDDARYDGNADNGAVYSAPQLSWSGAVPVDGSITVTYTVTVDTPDAGDHLLRNAVVGGSNCPATGADATCRTNTPVADYTVTKTASAGRATPGTTVVYTVTVANTGQVAYTDEQPATFTDDLSAVLDDATYNHDATNGASFADPAIAWSGALGVGETATVKYSVTVDRPDRGDHVLRNVVVGGTNCPAGGTDPSCGTRTPVADYTVGKTASASTAGVGGTITYTVTVKNVGAVDYTAADPATFADDLTGVLDDATYNGDATHGAVFADPTLSWGGALPIGQTVTVQYSVTVNQPDTGDHRLTNAVVGGTNCLTATARGCSTDTPVADFTVTKTASAAEARPGDKITYRVKIENTGQVDYTDADPASFTDDLTAVLDDATYDNDADHGATFAGTTVAWQGALAVGATVTVTYSVTVDDPDGGDHRLRNAVTGGSNCPDGATAAACRVTTPVRDYTVTKTASTGTVHPGGKITYTITVTNVGQVPFTDADPATFTDDLSDVLDDATYGGDATNGATYDAPVLSWSGALAVGASKVITYSVTVDQPDTGDHDLPNTVVGGRCLTAADDGCTADPKVQSYTARKTVSATTTNPGDTITYTVTLENTGQVAYTAADPATFADDLSGVLDDATYDGNATNGATYANGTISWSGALPVGAKVVVTYSVTVDRPDTGDHELVNAVVGGTDCPSGSTASTCRTVTPVADYTVVKTASTATAERGDTIQYQVVVTNVGRVAYTVADPARFTDDLSAVLDDATYLDDADHGATVGNGTLSWQGALAIGDSVTVRYSVQVNDPDQGDHVLRNAVVGGTNCPADADDPDCATTTKVRDYTVVKQASGDVFHPGDTVRYTITVTNTGALDYPAGGPASFTDNLAGVLDDATYDGDATNGATYDAPVLSWQGALAVGTAVTVTYSVTINDPVTGDGDLPNAVHGGNCDTGDEPGCAVDPKVQSYSAVKTVDQVKVVPGAKVTYKITLTNTGGAPYPANDPAAITDDLSAVLDDATYDGDATSGATYTAPTLAWSGPLAVGETVTITYSVTVNSPDTGDKKLNNTVVTTSDGGTCPLPMPPAGFARGAAAPTADTNPDCTARVPGAELTVVKTASSATTVPGKKVTYTITVTNSGQTDFPADHPATLTDDLSGVLDDATYDDDASSGAGVQGTTLTWSGPLAVGATATITYSVTVKADGAGDDVLRNAVHLPPTENSNCSTGSTDDRCRTSTPVARYRVVKTASAASVEPGRTVRYTITVTNTGQVAFTADQPASFVDDLSDVLDDARLDAGADPRLTYAEPRLSWSGALAIGAIETFRYSVTVDDPDRGNGKLHNVVVTTTTGGTSAVANCADAGDPGCSTQTAVRSAGTDGGGTAETGVDSGDTVLLAGLLLVAGLALTLIGRRRRRPVR